MALQILKFYILGRLAQRGEETVNSLSKALAFYRSIIYPTGTHHKLKTLKGERIPKVDIARTLSTLEKAGFVEKHPKTLYLGNGNKVWTQKAVIYTITPKGAYTFAQIMERYEEIEALIQNKTAHPNKETPFAV